MRAERSRGLSVSHTDVPPEGEPGAPGVHGSAEPSRPKGTRIYWRCHFCTGLCAESRMACTVCLRERREAIA